jgi:hypothetical protein
MRQLEAELDQKRQEELRALETELKAEAEQVMMMMMMTTVMMMHTK